MQIPSELPERLFYGTLPYLFIIFIAHLLLSIKHFLQTHQNPLNYFTILAKNYYRSCCEVHYKIH